MSDNKETEGIRISQVLAGALAAVTAALLGSTMGVAGTVIGAGLASVVSTVGGALYLRSIQRTSQRVRTVRDMVITRAGSTTVRVVGTTPATDAGGREGGGLDGDSAGRDGLDGGPEAGAADSPPAVTEPGRRSHRRLRWPALVAGSVLAFVLGMVLVTGIEWLRGEPLSGGEGTTVGDIVRTQPGGGEDRDEAPRPPAQDPTAGPGPTVTSTPTPSGGDERPPAPSSEPPAPDTTTSTTPPTSTGEAPTDPPSAPPSDTVG